MIVLCYHKICETEHDWNGIVTSPDTFRKQLEYIKDTIGFIGAEEFRKNSEADKALLTFDDGFEDNFFNVLPILEEMKLPAIFFVATATLEKREETWCNELVWLLLEGTEYPKFMNLHMNEKNETFKTETLEDRLDAYRIIRKYLLGAEVEARNELFREIKKYPGVEFSGKRDTHYMLSAEQLKRMAQSKYVTIGCHTVSHRSLARLCEKEQYEEIKNSKEVLERMLERAIEYFAYPFGGIYDYSPKTIEMLEELGFCSAFSTTYKRWSKEKSKFEIPRICISECRFEEFEKKIQHYRNKISYCFKEERE